jgi:hypothetical protein
MCGKIYLAIVVSLILSSCLIRAERKSAAYYHKNQIVIGQMLQDYQRLYDQQPFSIGFTNRSYTDYVLFFLTDTLRYIYNTETGKSKLSELIRRFNYDTTLLPELALKMKQTKCLWLDKTSFYLGEKKDTVTFLSFKSVLIDKPFVENKYYILIFSSHKLDHPEIKARLRRGDLVKINDFVYFMIGSHFR